jgi:uncharacterized membrane protein YkvA (DUF1232 family)
MSSSQNKADDSAVAAAIEKTRSKAEEYAGDPGKSGKLVADAMQKASTQDHSHGPLAGVWNNLTALFRLLQAYSRKEYTDIPWGSIVMVVVAIIYFVSPIDLVPDFLPVAGYIDDATVIAFVIRQIKADLDKFTAWEAEHKSV